MLLSGRRRCTFVAILVMATAMAASGLAVAERDVAVDGIAAIVGNYIILKSEVQKEAELNFKELAKTAEGEAVSLSSDRQKSIIKDTIEQMINEKLILREADEMKITIEPAEIDRTVDNMARENGIDKDTFKAALRAQGMDLATYRSMVKRKLLRYKVLGLKVRSRISISDEEARQYYNDQVRDVRATGAFEGAHILFRVDANARAAVAALARRRAEAVLARLRGGEDFATIAKELSEDSVTAPYGGSLGMREVKALPSVLSRAFLDLEEGEVAGPIRTPAGFHLIKLNKRDALGVKPFAEVKDNIIGQLIEEEMARQEKIWLKELRLRTFIDVRE